ncbi:MAG TPA: type II toxin-antitoxin system RelE/ParE family toxin [Alphaproteobacteria bacterium]|nr:type II toxin-antitoxin system RelE/ParE family toxin [Alphaproteobacteria bacterium]
MTYRVELIPRAVRELEALPQPIQKRIVRYLDQLAQTPRPPGCKNLQGTDELYRIHAGRDDVIVYQIEDDRVLVLILRVANRKEVDRNIPSRVQLRRPDPPT